MKLCRFQPQLIPLDQVGSSSAHPEPRLGVVSGDAVHEISGDLFGRWTETQRSWPLAGVKLLPPVAPSKIVCVGRNYIEHASELGNEVPKEPLIFLKPPSSIVAPDEAIELPPVSQRVDYEGELAVVFARTCARLGERGDLRPYIAGFTCLNDVTARDLQRTDAQWTRAKGFDTFCPLGPVLETQLDLAASHLETWVNGVRKQSAPFTQMIFSVDAIIRWVSRVMTLLPGDVIATGTPAGVGPLHEGDVVEVIVDGVGTLRNPVVARGE